MKIWFFSRNQYFLIQKSIRWKPFNMKLIFLNSFIIIILLLEFESHLTTITNSSLLLYEIIDMVWVSNEILYLGDNNGISWYPLIILT